jgi:hypothetical protein
VIGHVARRVAVDTELSEGRSSSAAADDNRTRGVLYAVVAHRAQQHFGERPVASAAKGQEVGAIGGVDQDAGRVALHDNALYWHG